MSEFVKSPSDFRIHCGRHGRCTVSSLQLKISPLYIIIFNQECVPLKSFPLVSLPKKQHHTDERCYKTVWTKCYPQGVPVTAGSRERPYNCPGKSNTVYSHGCREEVGFSKYYTNTGAVAMLSGEQRRIKGGLRTLPRLKAGVRYCVGVVMQVLCSKIDKYNHNHHIKKNLKPLR